MITEYLNYACTNYIVYPDTGFTYSLLLLFLKMGKHEDILACACCRDLEKDFGESHISCRVLCTESHASADLFSYCISYVHFPFLKKSEQRIVTDVMASERHMVIGSLLN